MKFSYTKNPESELFYKESKFNKGKGVGVWLGQVIFFQKNPSLKKKCFLFEGVKIR